MDQVTGSEKWKACTLLCSYGGQLFVIGGHGVYADTSVEVMSISSKTWSVGPSLPADYYGGEADQQPLLSIILSSICFTQMGM